MAKQSGLGDNFYIGGYNISGDVGSLGSISGSSAVLETTGIDKSAFERLGGQRTGTIEFSTFFNDASLQEHAILKTLPTADTQCLYFRGTVVGNAAAGMTCKQINYDGTRAADGSFTFNVQAQSNAFGLEWGTVLTAGPVSATGGSVTFPSFDTGASADFGIQVYYQVFAFAGTDALVKLQDSADNAAFATILTSTAVSAAPTFGRMVLSNTTTVRRYIRPIITTDTSYTNISFAMMAVKNPIAGVVF